MVWVASRFSDIDGNSINNLAEFGEPFDPNVPNSGYIDETTIPIDFKKIAVELSQQEVMTSGYGANVTALDFPIVEKFLSFGNLLPFGEFTFADLVRRGFASEGPPSDRFTTKSLYRAIPYAILTGNELKLDAAYVHGSVSFALMNPGPKTKGTRFINSSTVRRVEAEIGAGKDNWDFNSSNVWRLVNASVAVLIGPTHYNLEEPIIFYFTGPGKRSVAECNVYGVSLGSIPIELMHGFSRLGK